MVSLKLKVLSGNGKKERGDVVGLTGYEVVAKNRLRSRYISGCCVPSRAIRSVMYSSGTINFLARIHDISRDHRIS